MKLFQAMHDGEDIDIPRRRRSEAMFDLLMAGFDVSKLEEDRGVLFDKEQNICIAVIKV